MWVPPNDWGRHLVGPPVPEQEDTQGRTRYREPNMAHPPPSATPSNTKEWQRETWVARMASLSNFRHHVPGDIATPDDRQPAPSTYMTLMYNLHYTLSTTHYHAPTGHWVVHGTDPLLPADYAPPPHTTQAWTRTPGRTSRTTPTSGARGNASPWTRCSPSAAATRALVGRCIALPSGLSRPGGSPRTGGCGRSRCAPSKGRPPQTAGDPAPHDPPPYSSAHTGWQPASWRCSGRAPTDEPKTIPTSRRRTCPASRSASSAPSTTSSKRTHSSCSRYGQPPDNPRARTAEITPPHRHMHVHRHQHAQVTRESARTRPVPEPAPSFSLLAGPSILRPPPQPRALGRPPRPSPPPLTPQPQPPQPPHPPPPPHPHPALHPTKRGGNLPNGIQTRPHCRLPRRHQGPRPDEARARSPAKTQDPPPSSRPNPSARRSRNPQPDRSPSPSQAPRQQRKPDPPRTSSMTFSPSHPRPEGSSAQHGAPPTSPTPPPPPSLGSAPRSKRNAPRPTSSQSPHPGPTDRPRPGQNDARVRQQRPRPPTNPRCQATYSACPATTAAASPNPTPRQRPCAHTRESTSPRAPTPRAPPRHRTTRNPPGPPPSPVPTTPSPTHAHCSAQDCGPTQGQSWQRWTHTQLWELRKWARGEPSLEGLVHRPRKGSVENCRLQPAGGWMPQAAWGAMLADAPHPLGGQPLQPPCAPGPPVCPQAPAGDPPGDTARRHPPVGHHPKPSPAHTHTPPHHPTSVGAPTPAAPTAPKEPCAPHSTTRLTPQPAAPPPNPVT